ncbi:MAG: hypothetical protein AAB425_02820, partial [Bdellovibrionota bacterium]
MAIRVGKVIVQPLRAISRAFAILPAVAMILSSSIGCAVLNPTGREFWMSKSKKDQVPDWAKGAEEIRYDETGNLLILSIHHGERFLDPEICAREATQKAEERVYAEFVPKEQLRWGGERLASVQGKLTLREDYWQKYLDQSGGHT